LAAAGQARREISAGRLKRQKRGGGGVEDKKEGTMEEIEKQRAVYTRAKRREIALPDQSELSPKGHRTGT
jgi:hypothetical protein